MTFLAWELDLVVGTWICIKGGLDLVAWIANLVGCTWKLSALRLDCIPWIKLPLALDL